MHQKGSITFSIRTFVFVSFEFVLLFISPFFSSPYVVVVASISISQTKYNSVSTYAWLNRWKHSRITSIAAAAAATADDEKNKHKQKHQKRNKTVENNHVKWNIQRNGREKKWGWKYCLISIAIWEINSIVNSFAKRFVCVCVLERQRVF